MAAFKMTPAGVWTPQRSTAVAGNLVRAHQATPPQMHALGSQFYDKWHEDAQYLGQRVGATTEHGAAMIARLSPTTEAEVNRMMAYQLPHLDDRATAAVHKSAGYAEAARSVQGPEKEKLQKAAKQARAKAGLAGTPLNLQSSSAISKALKHRDQQSGPHPLDELGTVKIGDFGRTINDPSRERQVIDTHYHDAALGRLDIPYDAPRGLGAQSRYESFSSSATRAHHMAIKQGIIPEGTRPNDFMGGIWYGHQQRKIEASPSAAQARKASDTRNANFLGAAEAAKWDPAAVGMRPVMLGQHAR